MYCKLIRKIKRKGGHEHIMHTRIRHSLTVYATMRQPNILENQMKKVLTKFFMAVNQRMTLRKCNIEFNATFKTFQKKITAKAAAKSGKLEIMEDYFTRIVKTLEDKIGKKDCDKNMTKFIDNLSSIEPEVQTACLKRYLKMC